MKLSTLFKGLAVAASVAVLGTSASAISSTGSGFTTPTTGTFLDTGATSATIDFSWSGLDGTGTAAAGYFDFTVANFTQLNFNSYAPTGTVNQFSGLSLIDTTSGSSIVISAASEGAGCYSAPLAAIVGSCNRITDTTTTGLVKPAITPGKSIYVFAPGSYRIGIYETYLPTSGSAQFELEVLPVPAAGLLLAGAMGGLALRSRRKKKA